MSGLRKALCFLVTCVLSVAVVLTNVSAAAPTATSADSITYDDTNRTVTITLKTFLTDPTVLADLTIHGSDIVFLLDQSQNMNADRDTVISGINDMIGSLPTPTDGSSHRIAIAGYGRINNSNNGTPGSAVEGNSTITGASSGTGYYTYSSAGTVGFKSAAGWTEGSNVNTPPTISASNYGLTATGAYDTAFLTVANAKAVLDTNKMCTWYTGAARLDAGLVLANSLFNVANAADTANSRNTILVIIAASAAIQENSGNVSNRSGAATAEAAIIKTAGTTVFALGDYVHMTDKVDSSGNPVDTYDIFNNIFRNVTGTSTSSAVDADKYFVSKSEVLTIETAIKQLLTKVNNDVIGTASDSTTVATSTDVTSSMFIDVASVLKKYNLALTSATVSSYPFTGYDSTNTPLFSKTAEYTLTGQTVQVTNGVLSYTTTLTPIPSVSVAAKYIYGDEIVVTVTGIRAYDVTLNGTLSSTVATNIGEKQAAYLTAYTSTLSEKPDTVTVRVKDDNGVYQVLTGGYTYTASTGVLDIEAASVTNDIDIATHDYPAKTVNAISSKAENGTVQIVVGSEAGAAGANASSTVPYLGSATLKASTVAPTASFVGWYSSDDYADESLITNDKEYTISYNNLTNNETFYALFTNKHKVTYAYDGMVPEGATALADDTQYEYGAKVSLAADATAKGYTFSGWKTVVDANNNTIIVSDGTFVMPDSDVKVKGSFTPNTHKVTYQITGSYFASATYHVDNNVAYGTALTQIADDMTKAGYTFSVWSGLPTTMPDADVTVTGSYTINTHTVTYQVTGSYFTSATYHVDNNVAYGTALTQIADDMTKAGYTFSGWSGLPTTMPDADVTVTGSYTINSYTVTYEYTGTVPSDATAPLSGTSFSYGSNVTLAADATANGYTFSGWTVKKTNGEIITTTGTSSGKTFVMPAGNVVISGSFAINSYHLTYQYTGIVPTGAPSVPAVKEIIYKDTVAIIDAPVVEGYTFSGWTVTTPSGVTVNDSSFSMPSADVVITGQFTVNSHSVTYQYTGVVPSDATKLPDSTNYDFNTVIDIAPAATAQYYTFSGWTVKKSDGNTIAIVEDAFNMPDTDVTIIGSFKINTSDVTYKENGKDDDGDNIPDDAKQNVDDGSIIEVRPNGGIWHESDANQFLVVEQDMNLLSDPTYANHVFMGWLKTAGAADSDAAWVFTAQWADDNTGGTDDKPDGTPDIYQKKVTFRIKHGTWTAAAGDDADQVVYVTLVDADGKWDAEGTGILTAPDITTAAPLARYANGSWDKEVPSEVSGIDEATYTYAYVYQGGSVPSTGDATDVALYAATLAGSMLGLWLVICRRRRKAGC